MNAVQPTTRAVVTGRGPLLRALAHALGSDEKAERFLRETLWDARMDAVPESSLAYEAFVREEVLPRLMPMVRLERLHDLVRRTIGEEGSLHPPPLKPLGSAPGTPTRATARPRVVLVEPDAFRRVSISRELVRGGFDVEVVATAEDVLGVDAFHVVILSLDEAGENVARRLAASSTRAGLVAYDDPAHRAAIRRVIDAWPSDRIALVSRDAAPSTLSARVRVVVT